MYVFSIASENKTRKSIFTRWFSCKKTTSKGMKLAADTHIGH